MILCIQGFLSLLLETHHLPVHLLGFVTELEISVALRDVCASCCSAFQRPNDAQGGLQDLAPVTRLPTA